MTSGTQNLKIVFCVIFAISVFMMNSEYLRMFVITASRTLLQKAMPKHCFSYRCEFWFPLFFPDFIYALPGTIFSFVTGGIEKLFTAVNTAVNNCTFLMHCFMIAVRRAIFSLVYSTRYMCEFRSAFSTMRGYLFSRCQTQALTRAEFYGILPIRGHCENFSAVLTAYGMSYSGACHATH